MARPLSAQIEQLLATPEPAPLGPGPRSGVQSESALNRALDEIFSTAKIPRERQQLIRALVLLWHDHLDSAHSIAQDIQNTDGAFVHGIMHRREPDYGNAAYWFRRVGKHRTFREIAERTGVILSAKDKSLLDELTGGGDWDPFAFIQACENASREDGAIPQKAILEQVQGIETCVLLGSFVADVT